MRRLVLPAALLLCASPTAFAELRVADGASGTLEFSAVQAGAKFDGAFRKFQVRLDFDPAKPADGRLDVTVDTASVETQDEERDGILRGPDFLWCGKYPQASFHAGRFEPDAEGWRATGDLTLRGETRPVAVRFTLLPANAAIRGTASLKRLPFGVGQGEWASTEWVGDDVDLRFDLRLAPAG